MKKKQKIYKKIESHQTEQHIYDVIQKKNIPTSNDIRKIIKDSIKESRKHLKKNVNNQLKTTGNNNKITVIYEDLNGFSMPSVLKIKKT